MGLDLITILAVMGTVGVGNPLSLNPGFSIGGKSSKANNILDNLFGLLGASTLPFPRPYADLVSPGTPPGLDHSHNWIESDSSNTRDDLYVTGDASTMNMTLFLEAYNFSDDYVLTMDDIGARAAKRFEESISINPNFYYGPYTGMIARNSGYAFAGRILSNHTTEYPSGGHLSKSGRKYPFPLAISLTHSQPRMSSPASTPSTRRMVSWFTEKVMSRSQQIGIGSVRTTVWFN